MGQRLHSIPNGTTNGTTSRISARQALKIKGWAIFSLKSTVSKQPVAHRSSPSADICLEFTANPRNLQISGDFLFWFHLFPFVYRCIILTHFEAFSQLFDGLNLGQNPAKPPFSRGYGLIFGAKFSLVTGHSSRDQAVKIRILSRRGSPCLSLWRFEEI